MAAVSQCYIPDRWVAMSSLCYITRSPGGFSKPVSEVENTIRSEIGVHELIEKLIHTVEDSSGKDPVKLLNLGKVLHTVLEIWVFSTH